jgi:hypothetical protein
MCLSLGFLHGRTGSRDAAPKQAGRVTADVAAGPITHNASATARAAMTPRRLPPAGEAVATIAEAYVRGRASRRG